MNSQKVLKARSLKRQRSRELQTEIDASVRNSMRPRKRRRTNKDREAILQHMTSLVDQAKEKVGEQMWEAFSTALRDLSKSETPSSGRRRKSRAASHQLRKDRRKT